MERIQYFLWLVKMAGEALAFFWWLTLPSLVALVSSLFAPSVRGIAGFRVRHWRVALLGLVPVGILACGAAFTAAGEGSFALKLVYALMLAHVGLAGYLAWRGRREPWFFLALSGLLLVCSLASGFVAVMAISDVWL
jgi:nicotinamide riboside transporter PnuC